jgi:hypothetical protein
MAHYDVFLSHNSADKPAVEELARRLAKEGLQPWLDKWNLIPGEPWQAAIEDALRDCATCAVFIGPSGAGPWQNEEMRAAIDRRVGESQGDFRVIPVLLPGAERGERGRLPTFLVATTWVEFRRSLDDEDAFHRLVCGIRGIEPGPGPGGAICEGECPYRGLRFFDVEHTPFFFGREALTGWLLDALRGDNRFLAILGPSGSGKSSLARAGLLAALKQGEIEGSARWPVVISRPGPDPLESLAVALSPYTADVLDLAGKLREDERRLHITARVALRDAPPEQRLVVLVDQFEEVFTLCHDERQCQALIDNLLHAASVAKGQTVVLLTLRADFYSKCAAHPRLAAALSDHQLLVGPMTEDELRRAIERPARLAGCEFEPGLVDVLLRDVLDQPGGLPLLQHALLELWGQRQGRRLTLAAYQTIGGVAGALERRAEAVYSQLSAPEQEICRRIFLRLTQPGEGTEDTKRRASLRELLPAEGQTETVEAVVHTLAGPEVRLVTTEGDKAAEAERFVEVAHEALIRGWPRLREWIERDREALRVQRRLTEAAREWERCGRDESYLYRGARMAEANEWAEAHAGELNVQEREFLDTSTESAQREAAEREAQRQRELEAAHKLAEAQRQRAEEHARAAAGLRRRAYFLVGALVIAAVLAIVALVLGQQANQNARRAEQQREIARSGELAVLAASHLYDRLDLSFLLSAEAFRGLDTYQTRGSLLESLRASPHLARFLYDHSSSVSSVAFSPDGQTLASGSCGKKEDIDCTQGVIILWDVASGQPIGQPLAGHSDPVFSVAFSPDGKTLASGSYDQTIILWDVASGQPIGQPLAGHSSWVYSVAFSPDGKTLASGSSDNTILLWDVARRQRIGQPLTGHFGTVVSVAFSPDGKTLASGGEDKTIILWDVDPQSWLTRACRIVGRNFTRQEWDAYFPGETYRKTCEQWPEGK